VPATARPPDLQGFPPLKSVLTRDDASRMADPILWNLEPHTAAKHRVLRAYLDGWIAVMGQQALRVATPEAPRLLLVDGFAGPGRYATGEPGSPLIMLEALVRHSAFERLAGVHFILLFIEHDQRRVAHLEGEIQKLEPLSSNVTVKIQHGEFETTFGSLLDEVTDSGKQLVPTFAFIDPFGYSTSPMSLSGRLLDFPRCEVLSFLPLSFVHRFVGRDGQENAMNSLFGCEDWKAAIPMKGHERTQYLLELFERQLGRNTGVQHVRSFQLQTQDGEDYRLVFGLGHLKGLEIAKDAMWKVDPVSGTSYKATTESGQEVLFGAADTVTTAPLLRELRTKFQLDWFTIEQAEMCTLLDTPYRKGQLRMRTLTPAEKAGTLEVQRTGGGRAYTGAKLRFRS
jgi:three-Cys-motif partner protein